MGRLLLGAVALFVGLCATAEETVPLRARNDAAVQEVLAGTRTTASAAWWGFDAADATDALQAAIDSGAKTVVVPYMGAPWIVRPIRLRSDLELRFEPGVIVLAKAGEFRGTGDSLFTAADVHDLAIYGYGATLRMRKPDYQNPPYDKAEWRMGINLRGCERVTIEGVRIESTGGDGIYVGRGQLPYCKDVTIRNVVCHDNHRQGISVITAENLLIEGCTLSGTGGTAPQAGIDLEPNRADERLVNCVIRNCVMENNRGSGILVYLGPMSSQTTPLSIRFEDCLVRGGDSQGIVVSGLKDDGPGGTIDFVRCVTQNTSREAVRLSDKSVKAARIRFVQCAFREPWRDAPENPAVVIEARRPERTAEPGGVEFVACDAFALGSRPAFAYVPGGPAPALTNVQGSIFVHDDAGNVQEVTISH
jgi:polygalacturonase